ncbi:MAG: response regulator [Oscillospiraceae bacterium]|nr:response regulator [Oscillospiraceae bacterium]
MSYSVLIIDDEPMMCMGIKEMVNWKSHGFSKIDLRFSYQEGLKAALSGNYHLVLCDVRLQEQSGLNIIRQMKERAISSTVVIISAYAEFSYAQTALELGVFQYLLKPFPKEALESCLNRLIAQLPKKAVAEENCEHPDRSDKRRGTHMDRILEYIHDNATDPTLSLSRVASAFYMNASYLGQRFHHQNGVKFTDYLNLYRIVKACDLLLNTQYLTYEISEMVGFGNINYFHRVFKKITGVGTDEFRKKAPFGQVETPKLPSEFR